MLPDGATSARVIAGDIWCCCGAAGIVVCDEDLKQKCAIHIKPMAVGVGDVAVYDVAMMTHGELVVATSDGLYHTDLQGAFDGYRYQLAIILNSSDDFSAWPTSLSINLVKLVVTQHRLETLYPTMYYYRFSDQSSEDRPILERAVSPGSLLRVVD